MAPEAREWALRNERGLTYAALPPQGARIVAGEWWPPDYRGPPLISFDAELAHGMGLKVGDTLTVNLLGREITAQIANLRADRMEPARHQFRDRLRAGHAGSGAADPSRRRLRAAVATPSASPPRSPSAFRTSPRSRCARRSAAVAGLVERIGDAVRAIASATLAAGVLVLGGAIAAGHRRRVYDSVLLKVLGATPGFIAGMFLVEHLLLGFVTAAIAAGIGTLAAWALVTGPMHAGLDIPARAAAADGVGRGRADDRCSASPGTWRALGAKPAPYLRGE